MVNQSGLVKVDLGILAGTGRSAGRTGPPFCSATPPSGSLTDWVLGIGVLDVGLLGLLELLDVGLLDIGFEKLGSSTVVCIIPVLFADPSVWEW